jgi:DNA polymerase I-like protein with 3'-5' exonuclease and polymerase domains
VSQSIRDYAKVESRQHKEVKILEVIRDRGDLHTLTASQIFRVAIKHVTEKQRDLGKLTNLSRLYGTGLEGFIHRCRLAGVALSREELEAAYFAFDDVWPNLAAYRAYGQAHRDGASSTGDSLHVRAPDPAG